MSKQALDQHGFMDDSIPILDRLRSFIDEVDNLGYNVESISHGSLNEHYLSAAFGTPPQIIRMYFGLYLCDDEEKQFLGRKELDTGLLRTLMLIEPQIRKELYKQIDGILGYEFPITGIIDFVDHGAWRIRMRDVYEAVNKEYWAAVSGYLKDTGTVNGTITKSFRKLLMDIKIYGKASDKQLDWLERGIIHDFERELGIFTSEALSKIFSSDVDWIEHYLRDYELYDLSEGYY